MSASQELIDHIAGKVIMQEACSRLESFAMGDQAIALWTMLYLTVDALGEKLQPHDPPPKALDLFIQEAIGVYEEMTGQPWRPTEPAPVEALETAQA
jgi:hypothetical protein